jgi:hypothetical protein
VQPGRDGFPGMRRRIKGESLRLAPGLHPTSKILAARSGGRSRRWRLVGYGSSFPVTGVGPLGLRVDGRWKRAPLGLGTAGSLLVPQKLANVRCAVQLVGHQDPVREGTFSGPRTHPGEKICGDHAILMLAQERLQFLGVPRNALHLVVGRLDEFGCVANPFEHLAGPMQPLGVASGLP